MQRTFLFLILFIMFLWAQAQTAFSELAKSYAAEGNYERAIELGLESLELLRNQDDKQEFLEALKTVANYYALNCNYSEAIRLETEVLEQTARIVGKDNLSYSQTLSSLALYHAGSGNYNEAVLLETEAIEILERCFECDFPGIDMNFSNLARYYAALGNYSEAIQLQAKAVELTEKFYSKELIYAYKLSDLARYYAESGIYSNAIQLQIEALELIEKFSNKEDLGYIWKLSDLAEYTAGTENYPEAIRLQQEALNLIESLIGKENYGYVNGLNNLANYYHVLENYADAAKLESEIVDIMQRTGNENHPLYLNYILLSAIYYYDNGEYSESIRLTRKVLEILNESPKAINPSSLRSFLLLATLNSEIGNHLEAIRLQTEAVNILEDLVGEQSPEYARALSYLGMIYDGMDNYSEAITLGTKALSIFEATKNEDNPYYIDCLSNLAISYFNIGNVFDAILLLKKVIAIIEQNLGTDNLEYSSFLMRLASAYSYIENNSDAIKLAKKALEILEKCLGTRHSRYANTLESLGMIYNIIGENQSAIKVEAEALKIFEKTLGTEHPSYAFALYNLARYNFNEGNYSESIRIGKQALEIISNTKGVGSHVYRMLFTLLSDNFSSLRDYHNAITLLEEELKITEEILGKVHKDYASTLINLINLYSLVGNYEKMEEMSSTLLNSITALFKSTFSTLPTQDRINWVEKRFLMLSVITSLLCNIETPQMVSIGLNFVLFSKGLLLNTEIEFDKFLAETGDEALLEKYNDIKNIRLQLNKLYEKPIAERYVDTDSLERQANELERQLMQESAEFDDYTRNLSITWEDVQKRLGKKDASIEFVHFPLNNDSTMYMAYVLRQGAEAPELVKLFEEKDLTKHVDKDDKASIYTNKSASELIWGKLNPQLEGVENVYFAPDGALLQIAIEYLPNIDGEGMISDRFNLHRLSSTREIALTRHNAPTKEAVVYGGIKYDTAVATMETESRKYERPKTRGFSPYYNLGDSLALRGSLEYLDGSLTEAENINGMMKENNYNSTFLSGNDATEESFKNLSGKANGIIHISTHGFYWTESEEERKASLNDRLMFMSQMGDNARRNVEDKALTRTGLFMAGAKNVLGGVELPEDVDDGILTAQEIANLDLRGLDLVVLSACQTGMGDISGDGVFGLQRGFKKAGANTILMSLWDVSDEATQILMTNFYKNYLGGMSKQQALREAQKTVRETPGFSDPEYWAAFILLDALN